LQLIQRFYFPEKGRILIDGNDIKDYDIHHLRASLGVVSQEPTLFNGSFKYNIQYNIPNVPMEEIN
jgi:ATP-binding cassette subfamily B protein